MLPCQVDRGSSFTAKLSIRRVGRLLSLDRSARGSVMQVQLSEHTWITWTNLELVPRLDSLPDDCLSEALNHSRDGASPLSANEDPLISQ